MKVVFKLLMEVVSQDMFRDMREHKNDVKTGKRVSVIGTFLKDAGR